MLTENATKFLPHVYKSGNKFIVNNALLIAVLLSINSCSSRSNTAEQLALTKEQNKKIELATNGVVGMTNDGYVLGVKKQLIRAYSREKQVAEVIFKYFLVSGFEITRSLKKTKFKSNEDILKSSRKLQILFNEYIKLNLPSYFEDKNGVSHYINQKSGGKFLHTDGESYTLKKHRFLSKKLEEQEKDAINSFNAYLTYLRTSLIAGYLPSRITKEEYKIRSYEVTDEYKFKITINIPTNSQKFVGHDENNKPLYIDGKGVQVITVSGYFDIKTRTNANDELGTLGLNTTGMRFVDFSYKLQDFRE